jgi:hypothetical protein
MEPKPTLSNNLLIFNEILGIPQGTKLPFQN